MQVTGNFDQRLTDEAQMRRMLYQLKAGLEQVHRLGGEGSDTTVGDVDLCSPEDLQETGKMSQQVPQDEHALAHELSTTSPPGNRAPWPSMRGTST